MARNRKHESAAVRFGPAFKAFLLCLFIGGSGVGYVWQKNQIFELSQQVKRREVQLEALQRNNKRLRDHIDGLCSPVNLVERVKKLNPGLGVPSPDMVLRLPDPQAEPNLNPHPARLYADGRSAGSVRR